MGYKELNLQPKWFSSATPANPKKAKATLTFTGVVVAAETVTIGDEVFEFVAEAVNIAVATNIPVVVGTTLTADNAVEKLAIAINANSKIATAVGDKTEDTCVISYIKTGDAGNDVEIEETCTNASFGADVVKLSGGQFGTPCPIKDTVVYVSPYYYVCTIAGNKDNVEWMRFTPVLY